MERARERMRGERVGEEEIEKRLGLGERKGKEMRRGRGR